jgi:hypothetical protein
MSISRTTQISLAVILVSAVLPGSLALSAHEASGSIAVDPAATSPSATTPAATPKITRRSNLARHSRCDAPSTSPLSYHYPVKPFNRQHPIRGYFGDPRTLTSKHAVYAPGARGWFNIHNGIDIVTTTGTPVYPVASGFAFARNNVVFVRSPDGRIFQYYHVRPSTKWLGDPVVAYKTVLGHTLAHFGHVHLIEGAGTEMRNPLEPGHLEPYRDKTAPAVGKVLFADSRGNRVDPSQLSGKIGIAADASDMPALPIIGNWPGLSVTPSMIEWGLQTPNGGVVIAKRKAADFRKTRLPNRDFWKVYAAGTHQNKYGSIKVEQVRLVGRYSYNLTPTGLDTRTLPNGVYVLTIKAADTCGNNGSLSEQIKIAN